MLLLLVKISQEQLAENRRMRVRSEGAARFTIW